MKKRTETATVTAILDWLQCLKNLKRIAFVTRLQSGSVTTVKKHRRGDGSSREYFHRMRLCEDGTPDILCMLNDGHMVWIEAKDNKRMQTLKQFDFQFMVDNWDHHTYILARCLDDVVEYMKKDFGIKGGW